MVLDLNAGNGAFTLYAAKMGRDVIVIEPFGANVMAIHKASVQDNSHERIALFAHTLSRRRTTRASGTNDDLERSITSHYAHTQSRGVTSIELDDLAYHLATTRHSKNTNERTQQGSKRRKCIIKIDTNAFGPHVLDGARRLLDRHLDVQIIYMEWAMAWHVDKFPALVVTNFSDHQRLVTYLLASRRLYPFDQDMTTRLDSENFLDWPWYVIWIHESLVTPLFPPK